jgi:hypothetical protein
VERDAKEQCTFPKYQPFAHSDGTTAATAAAAARVAAETTPSKTQRQAKAATKHNRNVESAADAAPIPPVMTPPSGCPQFPPFMAPPRGCPPIPPVMTPPSGCLPIPPVMTPPSGCPPILPVMTPPSGCPPWKPKQPNFPPPGRPQQKHTSPPEQKATPYKDITPEERARRQAVALNENDAKLKKTKATAERQHPTQNVVPPKAKFARHEPKHVPPRYKLQEQDVADEPKHVPPRNILHANIAQRADNQQDVAESSAEEVINLLTVYF